MLILAYDENDNIVHIKDAEKGKSYRCPDCGAEVRPRKGTKKTHHFFHMNAEDCGNSGESIVHKYYKEFIASQKIVNYNGIEMTVTNSKIEQTLPNLLTGSHIIADVMLELGGYKWIAVEVCYKNHKDENHVDVYNEFDMECFEVYVDMNEQRTDFEITGYEKIASVKQYGAKIKEETKIETEKETEEKFKKEHDSALNYYKKRAEEMCSKFYESQKRTELHIVKSTGYYMSQLMDSFEIDGKMFTFIDLMNKINYMIKKHKPNFIYLQIKQINIYSTKDDYEDFIFDIEFHKDGEIVGKIENVYTYSIEYEYYYKGENNYGVTKYDNSIKRLALALANKYYYETEIKGNRIIRKTKPNSTMDIRKKNAIYIFIKGEIRGFKKRFNKFCC